MKKKIFILTLLFCILTSAFTAADAASTLYGDANSDGSVDTLDAARVLKHDIALIQLTDKQFLVADVNDDGYADNLDASYILKHIAGLIDEFPADGKIVYPEGAYIVKKYDAAEDINWDEVPKADIDIYKWVDSVEYEAYGQLVYIEGYGFICRMTCEESDPLTRYTQFGDPVYLDSCMEFFAAWDNVSYINIESNSVAALCAQFGATNKNRRPITDYLGANGIFTVTPEVGEEAWTLTMDIPIAKLQKFYGNGMTDDTFVSGYTFKGNFYKIGSDAVTGVRHYGMWTEVGGTSPNFHQPSYFGTFVIE